MRLSRHAGISWVQGVLILMVFAIVGLSVFAIVQSVQVSKRIDQATEGWYEDVPGYNQAQQEHLKTGKPMVVYFYAPWCPHCKRFTARILSSPEVQEHLKQYAKVKIYPAEGMQSEQSLMRQFGASGFPSFYVVVKGQAPVKIDTWQLVGSEVVERTPKGFIEAMRTAAKGSPTPTQTGAAP